MPRILAAACVLALALVTVHPVTGGPEAPSPYATAYNTQRKLARGPDGTLYAAVGVTAGGEEEVRDAPSAQATCRATA